VSAVNLDRTDVHAVSIAVKELDPQPRQARWGHLSLCVLDATFSINARYESTVAPLVHRYASYAKLPTVLFRGDELAGPISPRCDEQTLSAFLDSIGSMTDEAFAEDILNNRNRTSPRNGILKSAAARQIARALVDEGIETLADASALLGDLNRAKAAESRLSRIPGGGTQGIRTGYIWMTAGDNEHVKPDRHILGWLAGILQHQVTVAEARALLAETAKELDLTPWAVDHAIWKHRARKG
jgi:hypothetical protein